MAEGESDPVDDLHTLVQAVHVETNQRFNDLVRKLVPHLSAALALQRSTCSQQNG
eukprot:COSAG02_NODE_16719_length_1061_cov_1.391892_2_plen_55_part_00